jgi:hypothetical protein
VILLRLDSLLLLLHYRMDVWFNYVMPLEVIVIPYELLNCFNIVFAEQNCFKIVSLSILNCSDALLHRAVASFDILKMFLQGNVSLHNEK